MSIADELLTIANNTPSVCEAVKSAKTSVGGSVIAVNDVSNIEHNLAVRVDSKNLLGYPYTETTKTVNGITFTDNGDGSITLSGATTGYSYFYLCGNGSITGKKDFEKLLIDGATYTVSLGGKEGINIVGEIHNKDGSLLRYINNINKQTFTVDKSKYDYYYLRVYVNDSSLIFDNDIVYPQVEIGTTPTEYTPYKQGFSGVEVNRFGKNLFNQASTEVGTTPVGFSTTYPRNLEHGKWYTNLTLSGYYDSNRAVAVSLNGDNVTVKANATDDSTRLYGLSKALKCKPNTTYTLSYKMNNGVNKASGIGFYNADKIHTSFVYCDSGNSFTTPDNCYWILVCFHGNSEATEVTYSDIQLELGTATTAYEPYTEPQTATANTDGTVKGLISVSPNMTLTTDNSGVVINCEYISQTNAIVWDKYTELQNAFENAKSIVQGVS